MSTKATTRKTAKRRGDDLPKEDSKKPAKQKKERSSDVKGWNDMSHLSVKRFKDDDPTLTAGAKRDRAKRPYVACAEVDPSGRAKCKLCGERIPKGQIRLGLMLECHKGYRNLCTLHETCFWEHPETIKLSSAQEIFVHKGVTVEQSNDIKARFEKFKEENQSE